MEKGKEFTWLGELALSKYVANTKSALHHYNCIPGGHWPVEKYDAY